MQPRERNILKKVRCWVCSADPGHQQLLATWGHQVQIHDEERVVHVSDPPPKKNDLIKQNICRTRSSASRSLAKFNTLL